VRIHYEEARRRLPVVAHRRRRTELDHRRPGQSFNPIDEFKAEYRCIASDLRNANGGQSSGPLEIDRPLGCLHTPTTISA